MRKVIKIRKAIEVFKEVYFWDCAKDKIDLFDDAEFVIERVFSQSLNKQREIDLEKVIEIYPIDLIRQVAKNSTQIFGNKRIEQISERIGIRPEEINTYALAF
ncbi:MAG: hypothetical protein KGV57_01430 [Fusobacterium sp.]|nr:hypothetical protein [Fusobacterium sp.]